MARNLLLWLLALIITLASAYYQRKTGPSYPVDGTVDVNGVLVQYSLTRTHCGDGDQAVPFEAATAGVSGDLVYKRYKTDDAWTRLPLEVRGDSLYGWLPHQPPAGKLEYFVELEYEGSFHRVPETETVVTRFKGDVPMGVLIPHVLAMFLAMLLSTRAGLEALRRTGRPRPLVFITIVLLIIGGFIFGPLVQKHAFDAYWTGFPFGMDLTDNKTLIALIAWLLALWAIWKRDSLTEKPARRWFVLGASVVMLLIFIIPHSMMGSEIDYREMDRRRALEHKSPDTEAATEQEERSPADEGAPAGGTDVAPSDTETDAPAATDPR